MCQPRNRGPTSKPSTQTNQWTKSSVAKFETGNFSKARIEMDNHMHVGTQLIHIRIQSYSKSYVLD